MYRVILKCHKQYAMNDTSISSKFYSFGIHMKLLRNPYERERLFRMNLIWISHECNWDSYALDMKPIFHHYDDVIMSEIASQITSLTIVYSTVHSGADQSKHQSSASLAFVWEIHRWPVNFPHKWPVTRKMFPFDDVIMIRTSYELVPSHEFQ